MLDLDAGQGPGRRDFGCRDQSLKCRAHRVGSDVVDHIAGAFHNMQFAANFPRELDRLVFEAGDLVAVAVAVAVAGDEMDRTRQLTVELRAALARQQASSLIRSTLSPLG